MPLIAFIQPSLPWPLDTIHSFSPPQPLSPFTRSLELSAQPINETIYAVSQLQHTTHYIIMSEMTNNTKRYNCITPLPPSLIDCLSVPYLNRKTNKKDKSSFRPTRSRECCCPSTILVNAGVILEYSQELFENH